MRRWLQMEVGRRQVITVVRGPPPREDTLRDNAGRPRAEDVPLSESANTEDRPAV